ncbi:MAG: hypothetical protein KDC12_13600 [Flavobacteriales bacterium]|nr:hypothetical protein [Flavobacteriales bacterium]
MKVFRPVLHIVMFTFLTIISQVGGLEYVLIVYLSRLTRSRFKTRSQHIAFLTPVAMVVHAACVWVVIPHLAQALGREPLPISSQNIEAHAFHTVLLYRNYVNSGIESELNQITNAIQSECNNPNIKLVYLDACFPFFDGFPLLPHLSHNDGRKVDLAFLYSNDQGYIRGGVKNWLGYGVYENPLPGESNQPDKCAEAGFWQYSALSLVAFDHHPEYFTTASLNKSLVAQCTGNSRVQRIFLEPHLRERWNLSHPKIRYHGCHAVRHDDHIHLEFN